MKGREANAAKAARPAFKAPLTPLDDPEASPKQ
jgi:hypothetical protein